MDTPARVILECPGCQRELCGLHWSEGHAHIEGTIVAENGDPGGTLTVSTGGTRRQQRTRIVSTEPAVQPDTSADLGRKTLICNARRHRNPLRWSVTQATLDAAYQRAAAASRSRVSAAELRRP
jgi:hypothetical protein